MNQQDDPQGENRCPLRWRTIDTYYKVCTTARMYADASLKLQIKPEPYDSYKITYGDIEKYSVQKYIGSGRFSCVFKGVYDGGECAVKVFRPIQQDYIKREIYFLYRIRTCPNVIHFIDIVRDSLTNSIAHIAEYVHYKGARHLYPKFTLEDVRYYIYQLMRTLNECHSRGIMHRDIKPDNLLIDHEQKKIRLVDWGLAEVYFPKQQYSSYVGTLRYRSPELMMGYRYYDYCVDIWAAGVTMGEMLCRYPFFEGNYSEDIMHEIALLVSCSDLLVACDKYGIEMCDLFLKRMPSYNFYGWDALWENTRPEMRDRDAFDLLRRMLCPDHINRITAAEALNHPFLAKLSQSESIEKEKFQEQIQ